MTHLVQGNLSTSLRDPNLHKKENPRQIWQRTNVEENKDPLTNTAEVQRKDYGSRAGFTKHEAFFLHLYGVQLSAFVWCLDLAQHAFAGHFEQAGTLFPLTLVKQQWIHEHMFLQCTTVWSQRCKIAAVSHFMMIFIDLSAAWDNRTPGKRENHLFLTVKSYI